MEKYNSNIDMFDAYLNGKMSETNKAEFEARLKSDMSLRQEFTIHKELIAGECPQAYLE